MNEQFSNTLDAGIEKKEEIKTAIRTLLVMYGNLHELSDGGYDILPMGKLEEFNQLRNFIYDEMKGLAESSGEEAPEVTHWSFDYKMIRGKSREEFFSAMENDLRGLADRLEKIDLLEDGRRERFDKMAQISAELAKDNSR